MKFIIDYSEAAQDDLQESYNWYEEQRKGLGEEFLDEIEHQLSIIEANPESFPFYTKKFRNSNIKRFPFKIIYSIAKSSIKIWAIYHHKRNPKKWKR